MKRRAVFLDRDGTLVHPAHYPSRPEHLRLYEHIGSELYGIQLMGFRLIVVTNQSGVARGYFSEADLQAMHQHLARELAASDVSLNGIYYCPHHIDGVIPDLAIPCDCRKPEPGMLLRAADEHDLDLQRCWLVGDILDDIEAGNRAGCRTILVDLGTEQLPTSMLRCPTFVARDSCHALRIIQTVEAPGSTLELTYRPAQWIDAIAAGAGLVPAQSCPDCAISQNEEHIMEEQRCHIL